MCRFLCFLVILFTVGGRAASAVPIWNCNLNTQLLGDSQYFLFNGRDAWKGTGNLICRSELGERRKTVAIAFLSEDLGYGINETSTLSVAIKVVTTESPEELTVKIPVTSTSTAQGGLWQHSNGKTAVEVRLSRPYSRENLRSLQRGLFSILNIEVDR